MANTILLVLIYLPMTVLSIHIHYCPLQYHQCYSVYFSTPNNPPNASVCFINKPLQTLRNWQFSKHNLLYHHLPIEAEKRNFVRQVKNAIFSTCYPTPLSQPPKLVAASKEVLENALDLKYSDSLIQSKYFLDFFAGQVLPNGSTPISHRYGGHQFGHWAGQLGDGRAVMLGEYISNKGIRWALQLKGSGKTPYSRDGDGRAVLRSSIREYLVSEAMYHLGIPTTRAASIVTSDEPIWRDQFYDGHPRAEKAGIVLRLAPSWFRFGSIEILHYNQEFHLLNRLVDVIINLHYPHLSDDNRKYIKFYAEIINTTASLIAQWQSVGFTHGVCNTDNFSILSLTIDYGPFGFLDEYNDDFISNTSDDDGRYRFRFQPNVAYFNLDKLRIALSSLISEVDGQKELSNYKRIYRRHYLHIMRKKLGLKGSNKKDTKLITQMLKMMKNQKADFTMTFRELSEIDIQSINNGFQSENIQKSWSLSKVMRDNEWPKWIQNYLERLNVTNWKLYDDQDRQLRMQEVNPRYILRNYMAQIAINKANIGDFSEVRNLQNTLLNPFSKQRNAERLGYAAPPPVWASQLRVSCSS
ncbi:UPF0061 protein [Trichoplax sp. H2]|nr:UPF0061 protein [Trichoplax sp. H2]|eukprot:RDD47790.1 UPF0061 protein [Trichoplax sp. H2]